MKRIKSYFFVFLPVCIYFLSTEILLSQNEIINETKSEKSINKNIEDTDSSLKNKPTSLYKPTIGFGIGRMSFFGDLYEKHFQSPLTSRTCFELNINQPLNSFLYLNFFSVFGKLGANEMTEKRHVNFESEIRTGGIGLTYDFSNFIQTSQKIRPWIFAGLEGFEFLSKTDLFDAQGRKYFYWDDGSIKNMSQEAEGAENAIDLVRDYRYESDIREANLDGFGKYRESSWAIPIGIGFSIRLNERIDFKIGTTMHFSFTDYIDGVTAESKGNRKGTKANDRFLVSTFSLHYDLVMRKREADTLPDDYYDGIDLSALDKEDEDADGVVDWDDKCHKTPQGVAVDEKGCPLDGDKDLVADYRDEELPSDKGATVNSKGVTITEQMEMDWYNQYYDSTGMPVTIDLDSLKRNKKEILALKNKREYTVELGKFKGGVPSDVLAYFLSIGDVNSINIGDSILIYTAGSYEDILLANQRLEEFKSEGLKDAKVSFFQGEKFISANESDIKNEMNKVTENKKDKGMITDSSSTKQNATEETKEDLFYRVQLGAYKNKLSPAMFKNAGNVIELISEEGYHRYVSVSYKSMAEAAAAKAELVLEGYSDAFISAYKKGKRVSLADAGATYENKDDVKSENLDESKVTKGAIDKNLVSFRIQIGSLKRENDPLFEEKIKDVKNVDKMPTSLGLFRYITGDFKTYNEAVAAKNKIAEEGFNDAFVIATFKGEIISIQEATEILSEQK